MLNQPRQKIICYLVSFHHLWNILIWHCRTVFVLSMTWILLWWIFRFLLILLYSIPIFDNNIPTRNISFWQYSSLSIYFYVDISICNFTSHKFSWILHYRKIVLVLVSVRANASLHQETKISSKLALNSIWYLQGANVNFIWNH